MSAINAVRLLVLMGLDASPNLLSEAEDEKSALERGCTVRQMCRKPNPHDQDVADRLRAERIERKSANYRKRYNSAEEQKEK